MKHLYYSLGSFHVRLETQKATHSKIFEELFRVWRREPHVENQLVAIIRVRESLKPFGNISKALTDPIQHLVSEKKTIVRSDSVYGEIDLNRNPILVQITIRPEHPFYENYPHYLLVILNKFLMEVQRLHVHAAAINYKGKTCLFIGEKGSGKSTLCLGFGRAGATIIAEDHVMIRRIESAGYSVSGCDGYMRLTSDAEHYFFPDGVDAPIKNFAGTLKKEFEISRYFSSLPYVDFGISHIFLTKKWGELNLSRISTVDAATQMLRVLRNRHRFSDQNDIWKFIEYLEGLFHQSPTFQLSLPDSLDHIPELIKTIECIDDDRPVAG